MRPCSRPLDPFDAEAIASGEPPVSPDAARHAAECASCGELVRSASRLAAELDRVGGLELERCAAAQGLAERVLRVRPFSARERRTLKLWRAPLATAAGVFLSGFALLALPGLSIREQAGLGMAALAPLAGLLRALGRAAAETVSAAPAGLEALSSAIAAHPAWGIASLLLLVPAAAGLRRAVARQAR